ncbi:MAG: hypothetical protein U1E26_07965 [Coriobacteriia bacterium]|nr:hypothetical protein [Coriobacteriia bacterium]
MGRHSEGPYRDSYYPPQAVLQTVPCRECGKIAYSSRRQANSHIKRFDRENRKRASRDSLLRAYECPHGNGWHVAHARSQGQRIGMGARLSKSARLALANSLDWSGVPSVS